MRKLTYIVLGLGLIVSACGSKKKMPTVVDVQAQGYYLKIETTPCFGACPIYTMEFNAMRNVRYEAVKFVDPIGNFAAPALDSAFEGLYHAVEAIQWDTLAVRYMTGYTDLPSVILSYSEQAGDTVHINFEYEAAPLILQNLADQVEISRKTVNWQSVDLH